MAKFRSEEYDFGVNEIYEPALFEAASRTGIDPAAIASIINAEALRSATGLWNAESRNPDTSATGLTQFLRGTWREMAAEPTSLLHEECVRRGWFDEHGRVKPEAEQEFLDLRLDPRYSICAAAEYGVKNLRYLERHGHAADNDDRKAWLVYLAHHEGPAAALKFLNKTMTESDVSAGKFNANVPSRQRESLIERHGGRAAAYVAWLTSYIDRTIAPSRYRREISDQAPPAEPIPSPEAPQQPTPAPAPPPSTEAPEGPREPPPSPERPKPLPQSRTIWGAIVAFVAGAVALAAQLARQAGAWLDAHRQAWRAALGGLDPFWIVAAVFTAAIIVIIFARIDDRVRRRR